MKDQNPTNNILLKRWKIQGIINKYTSSKDKLSYNLNSLSILINSYTLYVAVDNYGLKIYKINDIVNTNSLLAKNLLSTSNLDSFGNYYSENNIDVYHPYVKSLDFHYNYLTNRTYVGMGLTNKFKDNEFFVEFYIQNDESEKDGAKTGEYKPMINKIFYSEEPVYFDKFVTDDYYSFFINKYTGKLIVLRRGLVNSISELTWVIPFHSLLKLDMKSYIPMTTIYDYNSNTLGVAFITSDNTWINLNGFKFKSEQLSCKFNKPGNYKISILSQSELCEGIGSDSYCSLELIGEVSVIEKVTPYLLTLKIVLAVLLISIAIATITAVFFYTKCFKTNITKTYWIDDENINPEYKPAMQQSPKKTVQSRGMSIEMKPIPDISNLSLDLSKLEVSVSVDN